MQLPAFVQQEVEEEEEQLHGQEHAPICRDALEPLVVIDRSAASVTVHLPQPHHEPLLTQMPPHVFDVPIMGLIDMACHKV